MSTDIAMVDAIEKITNTLTKLDDITRDIQKIREILDFIHIPDGFVFASFTGNLNTLLEEFEMAVTNEINNIEAELDR